MKGQYYITSNNDIYKFRDEHNDYLLCSPWTSGCDRRKKFEDLDNPQKIKKQKAAELINKQWRETTQRWTFNGKKYETRGVCYSEKTHEERIWKYDTYTHKYTVTNYKDCFKLCPKHTWHHISDYDDRNGIHRHYEWDESYYLVMYQGKLVWAAYSQYIPQVYYFPFESIDKEPGGFNKWTNINCIKPVYCVTDKCYI